MRNSSSFGENPDFWVSKWEILGLIVPKYEIERLEWSPDRNQGPRFPVPYLPIPELEIIERSGQRVLVCYNNWGVCSDNVSSDDIA